MEISRKFQKIDFVFDTWFSTEILENIFFKKITANNLIMVWLIFTGGLHILKKLNTFSVQ